MLLTMASATKYTMTPTVSILRSMRRTLGLFLYEQLVRRVICLAKREKASAIKQNKRRTQKHRHINTTNDRSTMCSSAAVTTTARQHERATNTQQQRALFKCRFNNQTNKQKRGSARSLVSARPAANYDASARTHTGTITSMTSLSIADRNIERRFTPTTSASSNRVQRASRQPVVFRRSLSQTTTLASFATYNQTCTTTRTTTLARLQVNHYSTFLLSRKQNASRHNS